MQTTDNATRGSAKATHKQTLLTTEMSEQIGEVLLKTIGKIMKQIFKTYKNQHPAVQRYIDFMDKGWPYRFFCTLTFQHELTDEQGIKFASEHMKRFNRKLLGRNWAEKSKACVTGIATLEHAGIRKRTKNGKSIKDRGSCHFHFVLHDHSVLDPNPALAMQRVTTAWERAARSLNYQKTKKLVSFHGTDVKLFQTKGVYGYMLKEAKNPTWKYQERLFYLDGQGLLSIDASKI